MGQFRFTFYNDDLAPVGLVVNEPDGWKSAQLILERHEKYHCVVKYFQADLLWYGAAADFIRQVISEQGPIAILECKIEFSEEINLWSELVLFRMDLSKKEGFSKGQYNYKIKVPLTQESEWIKFIARASIPVNVLGLKDMDENDIGIVDKFTLALPSQTIRQRLSAYVRNQSINVRNVDYLVITDPGVPDYAESAYSSFNVGDIIQIDLADIIDIDEIKTRFSIPFANTDGQQPAYFLTCLYNGNYSFDIRIEASLYSSTGANNSGNAGGGYTGGAQQVELKDVFQAANLYFELYFQVNNEAPILFATESSPLVLENISTYFTLNYTRDFNAGDSIRVYAKIIQDLDSINDELPAHPFLPFGTQLPPLGIGNVTIRDNINHLFFWGSDNSNLFLERYNFTLEIPAAGPLHAYYLFGADPSVPFDAGDPPSGLAKPTYIEIVANTTYDPTTTDSLLIKDAGQNILAKIIGNINCLDSDLLDSFKGLYAIQKLIHVRGKSMTDKPLFMSWDDWWNGFEPIIPIGMEFIGGKFVINGHEYFYNPEPVVSIPNIPDIVDSYDDKLFIKSIEVGYVKGQNQSEGGLDDPQTKRTMRTVNTSGIDYKQLSTFIAGGATIEQARRNRVEATKDFDTDEDTAIIALKNDLSVETGADFQAITNLINSDTRINIRISTMRNFLRALPNYNGSLVGLPTKKYIFSGGNGNYDMTSQGNFDDNEGDLVVDEKADINGGSTYQRLPDSYKFVMPMSKSLFDQIDAAKNHAINLSRTDADYIPHFIQRIAFTMFEGKAEFDMRLTIKEGSGVYRRLEDGTIRELEDGTKRLLE